MKEQNEKLNIENLDIQELERRLEMSVVETNAPNWMGIKPPVCPPTELCPTVPPNLID